MSTSLLDPSRARYRFRIVAPAYPRFNIYSRIARRTTALGPVCVATSVARMDRWDAEVIDENNLWSPAPFRQEVGADHLTLQRDRPADVVGLYGGLTSTIPRLYDVARFYKGLGAITVAGGQHFAPENLSEAFDNGIDYVVLGEGELTIRELLEALEGKRPLESVEGIAYLRDGLIHCNAPRPPITNFDALPLPDFSLVRYARIKIYPIERIRGCCMDCEFCTVKGKPRSGSIQRFLQNVAYLVETRQAEDFFVVDDLFGQERLQTIELCQMLGRYQASIGRRLCFTVQIRLDKARDQELLKAMRMAGVRYLAVGLESPIDQELAAMNKRIDADQMLSLVRAFRRFGFIVHGMFIFGYPAKGTAPVRIPLQARIRQFKRFIRKAKLDTIQVLLPVPLPGTELRHRLQLQGRVYPPDVIGWEYYDGNFPVFEPDPPHTARQMQQAIREIMGWFYRFRYLFLIGATFVSFPVVMLYIHNLRRGWDSWYRHWRNHLVRFGGWLTIQRWHLLFKKDRFMDKLAAARSRLFAPGNQLCSEHAQDSPG